MSTEQKWNQIPPTTVSKQVVNTVPLDQAIQDPTLVKFSTGVKTPLPYQPRTLENPNGGK